MFTDIKAQRTKLNALGWNPPSGMGLLHFNLDVPKGFNKVPVSINVTQQSLQKTNSQSKVLAPGATVTGEVMERAAHPNQATLEHAMNQNRVKRKRGDSFDEESKRIKTWAGGKFRCSTWVKEPLIRLDDGGGNLASLLDLPRTNLNIGFSALDSAYVSQLSLDHPNSNLLARGDRPLRSPRTPGMNTVQMVRAFGLTHRSIKLIKLPPMCRSMMMTLIHHTLIIRVRRLVKIPILV